MQRMEESQTEIGKLKDRLRKYEEVERKKSTTKETNKDKRDHNLPPEIISHLKDLRDYMVLNKLCQHEDGILHDP